jgi:oligosaccharide repeat unit polymerase
MMKRYQFLIWAGVAVAIGTLISIATSQEWFLTAFTLGLYAVLLLIFHRIYNLLNWIDPTVLFVVSYVTFIGVGIPFTGYYNVVLAPSVLLAILVGLTTFSAGAISFDALAFRPGRIRIRRSTSIVSVPRRGEIAWAWAFFVVGTLILLYYYYRVGTVPLLAEDAENVRVTVKAGLGYLPIGGFAFLNVSTLTLVAASAYRNHYYFLFVTILALITAFVLLLGTGYRMPSLEVLLGGFIVYSFTKNLSLSRLELIVLIVVVVVSLSIIGFYRLSGEFVQSLEQIEFMFKRTVWSIFMRYLYVFSIVMFFFPNMHPFMSGQSYLISAYTILPGAQSHFGFWLRDHLGLALTSPGPVDPTILGEFYANFGWAGIVVGMCVLGFGLRALYHFIMKKQPLSIGRLVLITLLSTSSISVVGSGIVLPLLFEVLPLAMVFAAYRLCVRVAWLLPRQKHVPAIKLTLGDYEAYQHN